MLTATIFLRKTKGHTIFIRSTTFVVQELEVVALDMSGSCSASLASALASPALNSGFKWSFPRVTPIRLTLGRLVRPHWVDWYV